MKDNLKDKIENLDPEQKQKLEEAKKKIMKELGFYMLGPLTDKGGNIIQPENLKEPAYSGTFRQMNVLANSAEKAFTLAKIYNQIHYCKRKQEEYQLGGEYYEWKIEL